ncbi:PQQ-dependent sugar dehydrogenase [Nocardioides sp. Soil796]|uniref:PQQ-dependent sugar dehydrogenase n=1 Tax=Nocardioides sp. Soil796 TaxID=1736412 RepID=UPI000B28D7D1|nr:PQQ-dependent sugar dehydrogenase [Nocardioides sp. Soil796]
MRRAAALSVVLFLALLAGLTPPGSADQSAEESKPRAAAVVPSLQVTRQVRNLQQPWDVKAIGGGRLLITERDTRRLLLYSRGRLRSLAYPKSSVWVSGETGLMSLAIDPGFARNHRFYMCQGGNAGSGRHDVRVVAWTLDFTHGRAVRSRVLLSGIQATSGRHGGCRLLIGRGGDLLVGTGDAAVGTNPQNLNSLNGKVLRLNRMTGKPWPTNPFLTSTNLKRRYVLTYGHRNVQGLAQRADGSLWSVEHGSYRDDEVNRLRTRGNYGWNPVPGYDESVPMTDQSLPGTQINARWRSGDPTIATSGAAWVRGSRWGVYNGTLAVAALKAERVLFMKFTAAGTLVSVRIPSALRSFGRLRSVTSAPNGDLLITTANDGNDAVLRVRPRS